MKLGILAHDRIGSIWVCTESRIAEMYRDETVKVEFVTRIWGMMPSHECAFVYNDVSLAQAEEIHRHILDYVRANGDYIDMPEINNFIQSMRINQ